MHPIQYVVIICDILVTPAGTKVVTRATFQLASRQHRKPYTFEVDTVSTVKGNSISVDIKPPATVAIGQ